MIPPSPSVVIFLIAWKLKHPESPDAAGCTDLVASPLHVGAVFHHEETVLVGDSHDRIHVAHLTGQVCQEDLLDALVDGQKNLYSDRWRAIRSPMGCGDTIR